MNILFLTLTPIRVNSSAMIRNSALIHGLLENNANIDIVTISSKVSTTFEDDTMDWDSKINIFEIEGNLNYEKLVNEKNTIIGKIKKTVIPFLRLIYHKVSVYDNSIAVAKKIKCNIVNEKYYDVVISSSDPKSSHIAAKNLISSGLKYGRWYQYWGDPLATDITQKTMLPKFILKKIEKKILLSADKIIYVSPFTQEVQKKIYAELSEKMFFLPIPYRRKKTYERNNSNLQDFKIGYFGDYKSSVRNLSVLHETCRELNLNLIIVGNSDINLEDTSRIKILGRQSQKIIEKMEASCDLLVCVLNREGTQIPGKIYHYSATNLPILLIVDGERKQEMRRYFKQFNRFNICDNDKTSITIEIKKIIASENTYKPCEHFEAQTIARQLLKL